MLYNEHGVAIGVGIPYSKLVSITTERLLELNPVPQESQFPITLTIADGSGSHRIYNQAPTNSNLSTKSFILFAFKALSLIDKTGKEIWILLQIHPL